ncbi:exopolysaccharide biosynthesis protein [Agrobacterium rosae]|uniref:Exopolysaccharide biosynthesis protein n=2 Tax=Agrobacterium rosae TaxID=1972867 RepID=A0AAE5RW43_9HYPH|nr:exopolysaccharide biosynthesis protein [Agrobacterium rosae]KAA3510071.1 exopolysaccharide biosynthesis protein [Agrobacterium rosae]KAA3514984.1 exopolysaccharide biosynthesis protein [Agrobacterium rosae]MCM2433341.1 exopolysaccharide biosynthesis protein [Agrobacterium rosae]MDX8300663.1 exopolysaccharide biosynthesis protein [Agrobacterium rosae]MDX8331991.1 exopolysaccharide biosynthesis protein [Agrobacterium rosae]
MTQNFTFTDTSESLSTVLQRLIGNLSGKTITLRELMEAIGEQGLLLMCAIACLPFLIPVSIPGVSTIFGAAIVMISLAITLNRLPWLPRRILDKQMETARLVPALQKGVSIVSKLDRYMRPRLPAFTTGTVMARINGLAIMTAGVLLMMPLGFVPFSNTLPGVAILLFSAGMIQRDGATVLGGYLFLILTTIYFAALAYGAFWAGQGLSNSLTGA